MLHDVYILYATPKTAGTRYTIKNITPEQVCSNANVILCLVAFIGYLTYMSGLPVVACFRSARSHTCWTDMFVLREARPIR